MKLSELWKGNVHYVVKNIRIPVISSINKYLTEVNSFDWSLIQSIEDWLPNRPVEPS
jgi:hypothetical protein